MLGGVFLCVGRACVLFFEFLLRDAHEFAGAVGRGEVGDLGEFVVVDLSGVSTLVNWGWGSLGVKEGWS